MAATKSDLRDWFIKGRFSAQAPYGYMVIVCDMFDWTDYPVYVVSREAAQAVVASRGSMEKVMEVYDLDMDMETQLAEYRAWHL